jgi:hypothetical protein
MLFMAWSDTGDCIQAYLVPDSFSNEASINCYSRGELLATVAANAFNAHVGPRHQTGKVGFVIDDTIVEGLATLRDLELRDTDSNLLVYRRTSEPVIQERMFRLETHLFPLWRLDLTFKPYFWYWYDRIDQHTSETARQILLFYKFGSLYSSGRILYKGFDYDIYNHQKTAIMLHDPYEELAERLLLFNRLGADANRLLNDRDAMIFAPIMEIASRLGVFDESELRRVLNKVAPRTLSLLGDPLTRQLVCATPDEPASRGAVNKALKTLSEFNVVGIRRRERLFTRGIGELLGLSDVEIPPVREIREVREIAANLRAVRWIEGLIENDLEVYDNVVEAFAATA